MKQRQDRISAQAGRAAALLGATLLLGGCALVRLPPPSTPPSAGTAGRAGTAATPAATSAAGRATAAASAVPAVTHNEVATPPGPDERAPGQPTPQAALRAFADGYINWDAADLERRLDGLAGDSVGQARAAMALAASQTGSDPELRQAGIANHGTVQAVAVLTGQANRYVVVTRETSTATDSSAYEGLAPAWHLTVATVVRRDGGWVVSGWQPES